MSPLLTDEELGKRLVATVRRVFPQSTNNRYAEQEWLKRFCGILTEIPVGEYALLRSSLMGEPWPEFELEPLIARMAKLAVRLEQDGLYVDSNIVFQAVEKLSDRL